MSLLGLKEGDEQRLIALCQQSRVRSIQQEEATGSTRRYIEQRLRASGTGSQEKKYVNVMGSHRKDPDLAMGLQQMQAAGFRAEVVPGPLLRATTGGRKPRLTCMPYSVSSAFGPTKELLEKAYLRVNRDGPDPDLEVREGQKPKWSTHSLRRMADTVARRDMQKLDVTSDEIDIYFGWQERLLLRQMQVHYAAMTIQTRMRKARITGML